MIPRPYYHFTPPQNFMNDPNGLVFFDGEYHLFYQYNPFGIDWGHMSWGHAVSRDLLHWEHLPLALQEENDIMIFSGSAVVDWQNTSGFGIGDQPPLIAIYTGHSQSEQTQNIAYSTDRGRTWTKYAGNPVISIGSTEFRDPKVFWHPKSGQWIMVTVLADRHQVRFDGSPDLKGWTHLSDFGPAGMTDGAWECPDLFPLPVEGQPEGRKWVLKMDVQFGIGAQCFIGEFDGQCFISDEPTDQFIRIDHGKDFYAAQSWSDTLDSRRIWIAWMNNWEYARVSPAETWRGQFSIPREVHLMNGDEGLHLIQRPIPELRKLRKERFRVVNADSSFANRLLAECKAELAHEIIAEFEIDNTASRFGFRVRAGDGEATLIGYDSESQTLFVDRRASGDASFSGRFAGVHSASLPPVDGKIQMHIFVDAGSVEVFGNAGMVVLSECIFPSEQSQRLEFFAEGGNVRVTSLDVYLLNPAAFQIQ